MRPLAKGSQRITSPIFHSARVIIQGKPSLSQLDRLRVVPRKQVQLSECGSPLAALQHLMHPHHQLQQADLPHRK